MADWADVTPPVTIVQHFGDRRGQSDPPSDPPKSLRQRVTEAPRSKQAAIGSGVVTLLLAIAKAAGWL